MSSQMFYLPEMNSEKFGALSPNGLRQGGEITPPCNCIRFPCDCDGETSTGIGTTCKGSDGLEYPIGHPKCKTTTNPTNPTNPTTPIQEKISFLTDWAKNNKLVSFVVIGGLVYLIYSFVGSRGSKTKRRVTTENWG